MQKTLLLVDDEPDLLEIIADILSEEGFLCFSANSADRALEFIMEYSTADRAIDLVVSDLNMPGSSGLELLKSARARGVNTPFFFLTGDVSDEELRPYFEMGVLGYELKPFHPDDFVSRLKALLA